MTPAGILQLYRMRLRSGLLQEAFAVIGIAVGVGLLFASQVANTSLKGSVGGLTSGLIGDASLQLQARGPNGFAEGLLAEVERLPGVRSAAPLLDEPASVSGHKGRESVELIGADPRFIRFSGSLLQHFKVRTLEHLHGIALPLPVVQRLGAKTLEVPNLEIGGRSVPVLLGVTLKEDEIGALVHSPVALAPLAFAQELSKMTGRITRIFVAAEPGREAEVRAGLERIARGAPERGAGGQRRKVVRQGRLVERHIDRGVRGDQCARWVRVRVQRDAADRAGAASPGRGSADRRL